MIYMVKFRRKKRKLLFLFFSVIIGIFFYKTDVYASTNYVEYSLSNTNTEQYYSANGIEYTVYGNPIGILGVKRAGFAGRTYTISKKGIGWQTSYKINVSNNKIIQAYELNVVATLGSFKASSLQKISSTKAQWRGIHSWGIDRTVYCTSIIKGTKLYVN